MLRAGLKQVKRGLTSICNEGSTSRLGQPLGDAVGVLQITPSQGAELVAMGTAGWGSRPEQWREGAGATNNKCEHVLCARQALCPAHETPELTKLHLLLPQNICTPYSQDPEVAERASRPVFSLSLGAKKWQG